MATTIEPTASTITVMQTLDLLDGNFAELADSIAQGNYTFWLGSGISRGRVDDLKPLICRVLAFLQERIDQNNNNCKYKRALDEILYFAQLSEIEKKGIDFAQKVNTWSTLETILSRLTSAYARLLDVRIEGEKEDYLLWEAVDVSNTYSPTNLTPDCEHICIAILAMKGIVPDIATANLD